MGRNLSKLAPLAVSKASKAGLYGDGGGLWLQVTSSGTKSWLFRYMKNGKAREMGLGALHTVSLAEAREKATEGRKLLLEGKDPIEEKRIKRQHDNLEAAKAISFAECAEKYIAAHKDGWKNAKHLYQWEATLKNYVNPHFEGLSVAAIDTGLVMKALEPIWKEKTETATRVRGRIESILDWATVRGYRTGENPARWRGHLDHLLAAPSKVAKVEHHPALPYAEMPEFMQELRSKKQIPAKALEFLILTATRTGETIGAKWQEIDLAAAQWVIPAERMKAEKEHRIPLCKRAMTILREMKEIKQSDYVFAGKKQGQPLSNLALLMTLRRMGHGDYTVHGFRSTFRDWCAEQTAYPRDVAEMALAHSLPDKVEAAYRRGDLLEKRQRLMDDWAKYCASKPVEKSSGNVVRIRGGSK